MEDLEEHRRVLRGLVSANGDISVLASELKGFQGWDVEPLVTLGASDIISILERFLRGDLSAEEVGIWADALEMRDDVDFGDDHATGVVTAVFELATEVVGARPVTPDVARELIAELEAQPTPGHGAQMPHPPPPPTPARRWDSDKHGRRYPCPCCGYKTLPGRGDYDVCPVCWWEDDGVEPWEYSGPNAVTLVEAQQAYLSESRPYRQRAGRVRAPKRREARDPDWRPYELTEDLLARVQRTNEEQRRHVEAERRRTAQEIADDPEGPFKEYNAEMQVLRAAAPALRHRVVKSRVRDLTREHDFTLPDAYLELLSRLLKEKDFYRRHPVHAAWWLLRHA